MAYKLLDMPQARRRHLDGAHLLPLVRAGIVFVDGVQQEGKAGKPRARHRVGRPPTRNPPRPTGNQLPDEPAPRYTPIRTGLQSGHLRDVDSSGR